MGEDAPQFDMAPRSDERPQFDARKAPDALRTIGEVAKAIGIRQHVLRYWEEQFPMLKPLKRSGGRRYYRPEDVAMVESIDRLVHKEGYTLKGAKAAIQGAGKNAQKQPAVRSVSPDIVPQLCAIRANLAAALALA